MKMSYEELSLEQAILELTDEQKAALWQIIKTYE